MSYAMQQRPLGDVEPWKQLYAQPTDVYLWRAMFQDAEMKAPEDAQAVLRSVAHAVEDLSLDVRGIVIEPLSGGASVDVVLTSDTTQPYALPSDARDIAKGVLSDPDLRQRFPQLSVSQPELLTMTGPPASQDFWLSHQTVWDDETGPLDAFAKMAGIYKPGHADDGPQLQAWNGGEPPIGPEPGTPPPPSGAEPSAALPLMMALLAGGVVYVAAKHFGAQL